ncbi:MAG: ribose-phosphate diphosphokinase [Actinobacteria bacterium]|nr:ribose-phosphate diphosphokinase [Actinomycetota bacterium]
MQSQKTQTVDGNDLKVFSGRANLVLAQQICTHLGLPLAKSRIDDFPDSEIMFKVDEDIRGRDVFIVQPTCEPVNDHLMELLVMLDCVRRASARSITAVIPYFGYARQDQKHEGRTPITAKLVANLITSAGADRVVTMDLHAGQVQGFFDIPLDHLQSQPVFTRYFTQQNLGPLTLVSPDIGNVKVDGQFARRLNADLAIIDKRRISDSEVQACNIIGDVSGRTILMFDDIISTAATICAAANLLKERGAGRIYVGATHAVFCGPAVERLSAAPIEQVVVSDTIPISSDKLAQLPKLKVLSVAGLLAETIKRIHFNLSVSSLFERETT